MQLSFRHGECNPTATASAILEHLGTKADGNLIAVDCDDTLFDGNIEMPVVIQRLMSVDQWGYNHATFKQLLCPLDFMALIRDHRQTPNAPQNTARIEQLGRDLLRLYAEIQRSKPALQSDKESFALKMHYFDEAMMQWNIFFSRERIAFSPVHRMRWFAGEKVTDVIEESQKVHNSTNQGIVLNSPNEDSLFVDLHPAERTDVRGLLQTLREAMNQRLMVVLTASNQHLVAARINRSIFKGELDMVVGSTMREIAGRSTAAMSSALTPSAKARKANEIATLSGQKVVPRIAIGNKPQDSPLGELAESNGGVFVVVS